MRTVKCTRCQHLAEYTGESDRGAGGDGVTVREYWAVTWHTCSHCGRELQRLVKRTKVKQNGHWPEKSTVTIHVRLSDWSLETIDLSEFNPEMLIIARHIRGLSQKELADGAGVGLDAIAKLEGGQTPMDGHDLQQLAIELDFPLKFFTREGKRMEAFVCSIPDYLEEFGIDQTKARATHDRRTD